MQAIPPPFKQIIHNTDVVVGDVMLVDTGDKIIADGVMVDGHHLVGWMGGWIGGWMAGQYSSRWLLNL